MSDDNFKGEMFPGPVHGPLDQSDKNKANNAWYRAIGVTPSQDAIHQNAGSTSGQTPRAVPNFGEISDLSDLIRGAAAGGFIPQHSANRLLGQDRTAQQSALERVASNPQAAQYYASEATARAQALRTARSAIIDPFIHSYNTNPANANKPKYEAQESVLGDELSLSVGPKNGWKRQVGVIPATDRSNPAMIGRFTVDNKMIDVPIGVNTKTGTTIYQEPASFNVQSQRFGSLFGSGEDPMARMKGHSQFFAEDDYEKRNLWVNPSSLSRMGPGGIAHQQDLQQIPENIFVSQNYKPLPGQGMLDLEAPENSQLVAKNEFYQKLKESGKRWVGNNALLYGSDYNQRDNQSTHVGTVEDLLDNPGWYRDKQGNVVTGAASPEKAIGKGAALGGRQDFVHLGTAAGVEDPRFMGKSGILTAGSGLDRSGYNVNTIFAGPGLPLPAGGGFVSDKWNPMAWQQTSKQFVLDDGKNSTGPYQMPAELEAQLQANRGRVFGPGESMDINGQPFDITGNWQSSSYTDWSTVQEGNSTRLVLGNVIQAGAPISFKDAGTKEHNATMDLSRLGPDWENADRITSLSNIKNLPQFYSSVVSGMSLDERARHLEAIGEHLDNVAQIRHGEETTPIVNRMAQHAIEESFRVRQATFDIDTHSMDAFLGSNQAARNQLATMINKSPEEFNQMAGPMLVNQVDLGNGKQRVTTNVPTFQINQKTNARVEQSGRSAMINTEAMMGILAGNSDAEFIKTIGGPDRARHAQIARSAFLNTGREGFNPFGNAVDVGSTSRSAAQEYSSQLITAEGKGTNSAQAQATLIQSMFGDSPIIMGGKTFASPNVVNSFSQTGQTGEEVNPYVRNYFSTVSNYLAGIGASDNPVSPDQNDLNRLEQSQRELVETSGFKKNLLTPASGSVRNNPYMSDVSLAPNEKVMHFEDIVDMEKARAREQGVNIDETHIRQQINDRIKTTGYAGTHLDIRYPDSDVATQSSTILNVLTPEQYYKRGGILQVQRGQELISPQVAQLGGGDNDSDRNAQTTTTDYIKGTQLPASSNESLVKKAKEHFAGEYKLQTEEWLMGKGRNRAELHKFWESWKPGVEDSREGRFSPAELGSVATERTAAAKIGMGRAFNLGRALLSDMHHTDERYATTSHFIGKIYQDALDSKLNAETGTPFSPGLEQMFSLMHTDLVTGYSGPGDVLPGMQGTRENNPGTLAFQKFAMRGTQAILMDDSLSAEAKANLLTDTNASAEQREFIANQVRQSNEAIGQLPSDGRTAEALRTPTADFAQAIASSYGANGEMVESNSIVGSIAAAAAYHTGEKGNTFSDPNRQDVMRRLQDKGAQQNAAVARLGKSISTVEELMLQTSTLSQGLMPGASSNAQMANANAFSQDIIARQLGENQGPRYGAQFLERSKAEKAQAKLEAARVQSATKAQGKPIISRADIAEMKQNQQTQQPRPSVAAKPYGRVNPSNADAPAVLLSGIVAPSVYQSNNIEDEYKAYDIRQPDGSMAKVSAKDLGKDIHKGIETGWDDDFAGIMGGQRPVAQEYKIDEHNPSSIHGVPIHGSVDAVTVNAQGEQSITDFKGSATPFNEGTKRKHAAQLAIYAHMLNELGSKGIGYTDENGKTVPFNIQSASLVRPDPETYVNTYNSALEAGISPELARHSAIMESRLAGESVEYSAAELEENYNKTSGRLKSVFDVMRRINPNLKASEFGMRMNPQPGPNGRYAPALDDLHGNWDRHLDTTLKQVGQHGTPEEIESIFEGKVTREQLMQGVSNEQVVQHLFPWDKGDRIQNTIAKRNQEAFDAGNPQSPTPPTPPPGNTGGSGGSSSGNVPSQPSGQGGVQDVRLAETPNVRIVKDFIPAAELARAQSASTQIGDMSIAQGHIQRISDQIAAGGQMTPGDAKYLKRIIPGLSAIDSAVTGAINTPSAKMNAATNTIMDEFGNQTSLGTTGTGIHGQTQAMLKMARGMSSGAYNPKQDLSSIAEMTGSGTSHGSITDLVAASAHTEKLVASIGRLNEVMQSAAGHSGKLSEAEYKLVAARQASFESNDRLAGHIKGLEPDQITQGQRDFLSDWEGAGGVGGKRATIAATLESPELVKAMAGAEYGFQQPGTKLQRLLDPFNKSGKARERAFADIADIMPDKETQPLQWAGLQAAGWAGSTLNTAMKSHWAMKNIGSIFFSPMLAGTNAYEQFQSSSLQQLAGSNVFGADAAVKSSAYTQSIGSQNLTDRATMTANRAFYGSVHPYEQLLQNSIGSVGASAAAIAMPALGAGLVANQIFDNPAAGIAIGATVATASAVGNIFEAGGDPTRQALTILDQNRNGRVSALKNDFWGVVGGGLANAADTIGTGLYGSRYNRISDYNNRLANQINQFGLGARDNMSPDVVSGAQTDFWNSISDQNIATQSQSNQAFSFTLGIMRNQSNGFGAIATETAKALSLNPNATQNIYGTASLTAQLSTGMPVFSQSDPRNAAALGSATALENTNPNLAGTYRGFGPQAAAAVQAAMMAGQSASQYSPYAIEQLSKKVAAGDTNAYRNFSFNTPYSLQRDSLALQYSAFSNSEQVSVAQMTAQTQYEHSDNSGNILWNTLTPREVTYSTRYGTVWDKLQDLSTDPRTKATLTRRSQTYGQMNQFYRNLGNTDQGSQNRAANAVGGNLDISDQSQQQAIYGLEAQGIAAENGLTGSVGKLLDVGIDPLKIAAQRAQQYDFAPGLADYKKLITDTISELSAGKLDLGRVAQGNFEQPFINAAADVQRQTGYNGAAQNYIANGSPSQRVGINSEYSTSASMASYGVDFSKSANVADAAYNSSNFALGNRLQLGQQQYQTQWTSWAAYGGSTAANAATLDAWNVRNGGNPQKNAFTQAVIGGDPRANAMYADQNGSAFGEQDWRRTVQTGSRGGTPGLTAGTDESISPLTGLGRIMDSGKRGGLIHTAGGAFNVVQLSMMNTQQLSDQMNQEQNTVQQYDFNLQDVQFKRSLAQTTGKGLSGYGTQVTAAAASLGISGAGKYAAAVASGQGEWQLEDKSIALSRAQQSFNYMMSGKDIAINEQQFALSGQQFAQTFAFNKQRTQTQQAWQQQDMTISYSHNQQQAQWGLQSQQYGRDVNEVQFAWQQQDFDRNIRYSRGRDRQDLMRQQERSVVMHSMEMGQSDTQMSHAKTQMQWADEQFAKDKTRFEQNKQWTQQEMDIQKQQFDETRTLERSKLDNVKESYRREGEFIQEQRQQEDQLRNFRRGMYLIDTAETQDSIAFHKKETITIKSLADAIGIANDYTQKFITTLQWFKDNGDLAGKTQPPSGSGPQPGPTPPDTPTQPPRYMPPTPIHNPSHGFSAGGYTGYGGTYEPAGEVHKKEWVVPENGNLVVRGDSGQVEHLKKAVDLLAQLVNQGQIRPNVTIHTSGKPSDALDGILSAKDKAYAMRGSQGQ